MRGFAGKMSVEIPLFSPRIVSTPHSLIWLEAALLAKKKIGIQGKETNPYKRRRGKPTLGGCCPVQVKFDIVVIPPRQGEAGHRGRK